MIFQEATEEDIALIAQLEKESIPGEPWKEADFASCLSNPNAFLMVAADETGVIGYVAVYVAADEGEIPTIAVAPECRGKRIATFMLTETFALLKTVNVKKVFLEVRASNTAARKLYETFGFNEIGRRRNFYREPVEDALMLACDL